MGRLLEETSIKSEGFLATAKLCHFHLHSWEGKKYKIKITGGRARNKGTAHNLFTSAPVP